MTPAIARALAAVLAALAIVAAIAGAVFYVRRLRADLAAAELAAQTAQDGNRERDRAIGALVKNGRDNDAARARLEKERDGIRAALDKRENDFRRMVDENAELRAWVSVSLPGVVIGLHDHAAITGADGYQTHLRAREALHAAGGKPTQ